MGKKRSKTAKQKQAKASRRDKKFGTLVVKGGTKTKSVGGNVQLTIDHKSSNKKKRNNHNNNTKSNKNKMDGSAQFSSPLQREKKQDQEHDDFDRQMASAQDRHHHAANTNNRSNNHNNGMAPSFAPATLCIDDSKKSTTRLMEETTGRIHDGLSGIGGTLPQPTHQKSSLQQATSATNVWSAHNTTNNTPSVLERDNPYAVLEGHDSSDDEDHGDAHYRQEQPTLPLFRLAPPTFSLQSDTHNDVEVQLAMS